MIFKFVIPGLTRNPETRKPAREGSVLRSLADGGEREIEDLVL